MTLIPHQVYGTQQVYWPSNWVAIGIDDNNFPTSQSRIPNTSTDPQELICGIESRVGDGYIHVGKGY